MTLQLSADTKLLKVLGQFKAKSEEINASKNWPDERIDAAVDRNDRVVAKVVGLPITTAAGGSRRARFSLHGPSAKLFECLS